MKQATTTKSKVNNATKSKTTAKQSKTTAKQSETKVSEKAPKNPVIKTMGKKGVIVNGVAYLSEGVTKKQLQDKVLEVNRSHKKEFGGYMFCLKQVVKHSNGFLEMLGLTAEELMAGINLQEFLTPHQTKMLQKSKCEIFPNGKYSVWMVEQLVKKYAQNKASQK